VAAGWLPDPTGTEDGDATQWEGDGMGASVDGTVAAGPEETAIRALYHGLLAAWNARDAMAYAAHFDETATVVGFDGSQMDGRTAIERTLAGIFADHATGRYVGIVRRVGWLAPEVVLLRAVAGLTPANANDINPALNAVQTLVAVHHSDAWRVALFQNTPAQLHNWPDLAETLTQELRALL
jgi:uncharacterized protein (TIGR02246 family)